MMHILRSLIVFSLVTTPAFAQSWTAPRTWVANEVVTASIMNAHVRDNLTVLRAGGFAVTSQAQGDLLCASSASQFARLAGAAAGSFLAAAGTTTCPTYAGTEFYINDTANAFVTIGVTINQAGNDDAILDFKSSDVAHDMTAIAEADTYGTVQKASATLGGLMVLGYAETASEIGLYLVGRAGTDDTTKTSSTTGYVHIIGQKRSGTTVGAVGAGAAVLTIASDATTGGVFTAEGDLWLLGNLMLETGSAPQQTTPVSTGTTTWGISGTTVWMGTPAVWFVVENESGTSYRVPGYTP